MTEQQVQIYSFTVSIQSIKMKVKFPCRMGLQLKGNQIAAEVPPNQNHKFIFNKQVTLNEHNDKHYFEITVNIITDKNVKYIAGIVRLQQTQLMRQQGQLLTIPLTKCLDPQSTCQLRVDQVSSQKVMKKVQPQKSFLHRSRVNSRSPEHLTLPNGIQGGGTKSQFQFPLNNNKNRFEQHKTREDGLLSSINKKKSPYHFRQNNIAATHIQRNLPDFHASNINREKLIEAEAYKEGYVKLRDKYKRQAENAKHELNKRIAVQNSENNYKLQLMRVKLKLQENEKAVVEKNSKIRQLQNQVSNLQKKEMDLQYLKQQSNNKDHTIKMLEETIKTLHKDNEDLKELNRERFESQQRKISQLRNQIQTIKTKFEYREQELQRKIKGNLQEISQKQLDLKLKQDQLEREKRLVEELQRNNQSKMYEFERTLQSQKMTTKGKLQEMKNKYEKLQKIKLGVDEQLKQAKSEIQKYKSLVNRLEYDKKVLNEEVDRNNVEIRDLKATKEKYLQLLRDHKLQTQDKNHLQKQLEKTINAKQGSIHELTKQHSQQVEYYKKIFKECDEKMKISQAKNVELESQLQQRKNELQKMKRVHQNLNRDYNELKERQKSIERSLKQRQQELTNLNMKMGNFHHKSKSGDQILRQQLQKVSDECSKYKLDYESEAIKSIQLGEKVTNLSLDLNKTKLKLQYAQEQIEKDTAGFKDNVQNLQNTIRANEHKIQQLNDIINGYKGSEKDNMGKIQKMDIQGMKSSQKIDRLLKDNKVLEEKVSHTQKIVKSKQADIGVLNKTKENLDKKIQQLQEKLLTAKNEVKTLGGQKQKNQKIITILNKDIDKHKQDIDRNKKTIQAKDKLEDELRSQIKKHREDYLKLEMKNNGLKKEYEKFKENLLQSSTASFSQIPMATDFKVSTVSIDVSKPKEQSINSNDVINKIVSQNKDLKMAMSKMLERNKILHMQTQKMHEDMQSNNNRHSQEQQELNKQIQQLQQQLSLCYNDKQQYKMRTDGIMQELNKTIHQLQGGNKDLYIQIQELNFTIDSLKLDSNANIEHYNIKYGQYRAKIGQLQQKLQYTAKMLSQQESRSHQLDQNLINMTTNFQSEKEVCIRREKEIEDLKRDKQQLYKLLQQLKKNKKELLEKVSQLQFKYATQLQVKEKTKGLLQSQEHKGTQLKGFIADLMKQKETAIKKELQKSQQIIILQSNILQLTRDKEILSQENEKNRIAIEEYKENTKKLNKKVKDLEDQIQQQKTRQHRLSQKLRDREREYNIKEEEYEHMSKLYNEEKEKWHNNNSNLQGQYDDHKMINNKLVAQYKENILQLQKTIKDNNAKLQKNKAELMSQEQSLFMERSNNEYKESRINQLEEEISDYKFRIDNMEINLHTNNEEIKEKEENLFQLSGKIYNLQVKVQDKETQKNQRIQHLIEDWSCKYDGMCEQYEQRIQLMNKEKDLLKSKVLEREEQVKKYSSQLKETQIVGSNNKNNLSQKIKKLQGQKLSAISTKNTQIQKLTQENKTHFNNIKRKEADNRRLNQDLQIARSTINKLEFGKKEAEEKIKNNSKVYQTELEQLKKKEIAYRNVKQAFGKCQWVIEREVRKVIQSYIKKLISGNEQQTNHKIMDNIRGLQQSIVSVVHNKLQQVK